MIEADLNAVRVGLNAVRVGLKERSYDILIGGGLLAQAGAQMRERLKITQGVVITDESVAKHHLPALMESVSTASIAVGEPIILPSGETTKSFAFLENLIVRLLERGVERRTPLIAFGGGVVGDLVGFAAAITLRGMPFIQIPTTLLAQVDSSVGGKTGINTAFGKNLVGAFHQPQLVLADTSLLGSLPQRDRLAGYAEVVKYGLINNPAFFNWLEVHGAAVCANDGSERRHAVAVCCQAKADIVGADERENDQRALLNLGHTFGHALEAAAGFDSEKLRHGEAIAIGMVLAFALSARLGLASVADGERIRNHLSAVGLPVSSTDIPCVPWNVDELLAHMQHDKKISNGRITFVLARGIGQAFLARNVDMKDVAAVLDQEISLKNEKRHGI
ncbi:3-dehydroquinate synthase [Azospirillaceae bacterium]